MIFLVITGISMVSMIIHVQILLTTWTVSMNVLGPLQVLAWTLYDKMMSGWTREDVWITEMGMDIQGLIRGVGLVMEINTGMDTCVMSSQASFGVAHQVLS